MVDVVLGLWGVAGVLAVVLLGMTLWRRIRGAGGQVVQVPSGPVGSKKGGVKDEKDNKISTRPWAGYEIEHYDDKLGVADGV